MDMRDGAFVGQFGDQKSSKKGVREKNRVRGSLGKPDGFQPGGDCTVGGDAPEGSHGSGHRLWQSLTLMWSCLANCVGPSKYSAHVGLHTGFGCRNLPKSLAGSICFLCLVSGVSKLSAHFSQWSLGFLQLSC